MFVGRDAEVIAVGSALRTRSCVLVLVGGAGVGKSRLLQEAAKAGQDEVRVVAGHCLPLSVDLPLLPIVDILRGLFTLDGGAVLDDALSGTPTYVRGELQRLLPELGDAPPGDASRQRQFEAVRQVFIEARSVAIVIDDLHWCDAASLDLLEYIIVRPDAPAMVFAIRPLTDISDRIQRWLVRVMRLPAVHRLELGPLSSDSVHLMLTALDWTGTRAAANLLAARSGGIPYYVEQLAALHADEALPQSVQALLRERLAGLSKGAVNILRVLSVAGRPVTDEELQAACGERTGEALRVLNGRGLIAISPGPGGSKRRAPVHALLAEAVRAELTSGELRDLHRRVADAFARQPDVDSDDVARHLSRAGDKAAESQWRLRAAVQARFRAAPREAYGHLARAIALDPDADVQVYLDAYTLARHAGETTAAAELAERMLTRFEATATDEVRMRLWHAVGHHRVLRGRSGLDALARAVEIGRSLPRTAQFGYLLYDFERHLRGHGRDNDARVVNLELAQVAACCDDSDLSRLADVESACHALLLGDDHSATAALARAEQGSAQAIGQGLNAAAMVTSLLLMTGHLTETVAFGERVIAQRDAAGLSAASVTGSLRADVAAALLEQGRVDDAQRALAPADVIGTAPDAAASAQMQSMVDAACGRFAEALRYWNDEPQLSSYPLRVAEAAPQRLSVLVDAGRPDEAVVHGLDALRLILSCDQSRFAGLTIQLARGALADLVEAGRAPSDAKAHSVRLDAAIEAAPIDPFAPRSYPVTGKAAGLTDRAERSRLNGRSDPTLWRVAAEAWRALGRPWRAGYCGWRGAHAALGTRGSRPQAVTTLQKAWLEASGNVPLQSAIRELSRVARIQLPISEPITPAPDQLFTEREIAVLRLLAEGRTNAEIGSALYMSPKTASVHVTHILRKLHVRTRVEAATHAQRAGLVS